LNYRNKHLTRLARFIPCSGCGIDDGTQVWAHSNFLRHGKGTGIKAHDYYGAILCYKCHCELDGGKLTKEEREEFFNTAFQNTIAALWLGEFIEVKREYRK